MTNQLIKLENEIPYDIQDDNAVCDFNRKVWNSIQTSYPVYDMGVVGEICGSEVNEFCKYDTLKEYIFDWSSMIFDGGIFAKSGGSSSGANSAGIVKNYKAAFKGLLEYSNGTRKEAAAEFRKMLDIVKSTPDYVLVEFGVENDLSFIAIHKQDYKILKKFKVYKD